MIDSTAIATTRSQSSSFFVSDVSHVAASQKGKISGCIGSKEEQETETCKEHRTPRRSIEASLWSLLASLCFMLSAQ